MNKLSARLSPEEIKDITPLIDDLKEFINEEPDKTRRLTKALYSIVNLVFGLEGVSLLEAEGLLSVGSKFIYDTYRNKKPSAGKSGDLPDVSSYIR